MTNDKVEGNGNLIIDYPGDEEPKMFLYVKEDGSIGSMSASDDPDALSDMYPEDRSGSAGISEIPIAPSKETLSDATSSETQSGTAAGGDEIPEISAAAPKETGVGTVTTSPFADEDDFGAGDGIQDGDGYEKGRAKWYVVHTYSGHENKVKVNIEKIVENRGMQDLVLKIIVPTEDRVEISNGQRKVKTRKMFPGYVLVKMIVTNESWYLVRNTQGVTGFVGHGSEPIPLTKDEVRRMGIEKIYIDLDIDVGDTVKVINGPFESFMGVVEEVNMEKQTLKARISMFGRDTPVELEFGQVDKI